MGKSSLRGAGGLATGGKPGRGGREVGAPRLRAGVAGGAALA